MVEFKLLKLDLTNDYDGTLNSMLGQHKEYLGNHVKYQTDVDFYEIVSSKERFLKQRSMEC